MAPSQTANHLLLRADARNSSQVASPLAARQLTRALIARVVDRLDFPSPTNPDRLCRFRPFRAGLDVTDNDSSTVNPTRSTIRGTPDRELTRPTGRTVVSAWVWRRY